MPVKTLIEGIQWPAWATQRYKRLDIYQRFLDGTIYDHIEKPFHVEVEEGTKQYIPLRERRPSVIYNIPRFIVNRSTRLVFAGKHFPKIIASDQGALNFIQRIVDKTNLKEAMLEAAYTGSIGSVAVLIKIVDGEYSFEAINSRHCIPVFDRLGDLSELHVRYIVYGIDLYSCGYDIPEEDWNTEYFFCKKLTTTEEIVYQPIKEFEWDSSDPEQLKVDAERTTKHSLNVVPAVWIKNLYPAAGIDGECTFARMLEICVEIDYQLSQVGRGLKYCSDPQLLVKEPIGQDPSVIDPMGGVDSLAAMPRSASQAIVVGKDGDAQLLEMSGQGQKVVLDFVKQLRQYALEVASASRKDPDNAYGNMSGRAMEILEGDLISFASVLQLSYGDGGLKPLLIKVLKIANQLGDFKSKVFDQKDFALSFVWGNWFEPTPTDHLQEEQALKLAYDGRRLFAHEGRSLTATRWNVGGENSEEMEDRWPLPPEPEMSAADKAKLKMREKNVPSAPGDDGRGTQGFTLG